LTGRAGSSRNRCWTRSIKIDGPVKSRKINKIVIPAKAGIQEFQVVTKHWTPVFTGVTTFYDFIKIESGIQEPEAGIQKQDFGIKEFEVRMEKTAECCTIVLSGKNK
jgi:hypothetical protein